MVKKIIQQQSEEIEPEGTQEETQQHEEVEEVEEVQPVTKPKRVLTEKQLESLA